MAGFFKHHRFDIHLSNFRIHFYDTDAVEIQLDVFNRRRAFLQGNEAGCSAISGADVVGI
jgi:hypothetical protein